MNGKSKKGEPQTRAGVLGPGTGALPLALLDDSQSLASPCTVIVPQNAVNCQERTVSETGALLALIDDVLERYNAAKAAYIAGGDPGDFRAAMALAEDRRALLAQIGGETWRA